MTDGTTCTTAQAGPPAPAGVLLSQIDVALKRLAAKHWAQVEETMKRQGFAPADGGIYVLPEDQREKAPGYRPEWVWFSAAVTAPALVNPRKLGLAP